ncbi:MAG: phosphoribosyl-AMP cyclohydrolase [Pseudomonadota bacterium]
MKFDPATLTYNENGLLPVIAQDADTGMVLMLAWMNAEAIQRTLSTGHVTYWSRSRQEFWVKGATSGHTQQLVSMSVDCDRDCVLVSVKQIGPACHTGRKSCFYTDVTSGDETETLSPMAEN